MLYSDAVAFLYERLPMFQRLGAPAFKKDLTNTLRLCTYLGNPQKKFKSIHIAGTNGKGTTAHSLAAVFQAAGYKTGLYTSPHLQSFTERIRINGLPIPEEVVGSFVSNHKQAILAISPSFFEVTVAMAFDFFASQKVDIAIIEVGLGGRLDSTNIIDPELCVITRIGLDHQEFLGDSLEQIAGEKAGIIKQETPVVIGVTQPETRGVFLKKAHSQHAPIYFAEEELKLEKVRFNSEGLHFTLELPGHDLQEFTLGLHGEYQRFNIAGIMKSLLYLRENGWNISWTAIRKGLAEVSTLTGLRGRWQVLGKQPLVIADTGHNWDGLSSNLSQIRQIPHDTTHFVLGFVRDKDISSILGLFPQEARYYFTQASIPRALPVEELNELAASFGLRGQTYPDVTRALAAAKAHASQGDLIYVGGSTFVVAELDEL